MKKLLSSAALALALAAPAGAFDLTAMSDAEREAFRAEIRQYLLDNPQVIMEAVAVLEQREADQQAENDKTLVQVNADALFNDGYSWTGGNPEGDLTLVEFVDYRCGYCRKAHDEVAQFVETDDNIRFVLKEFPILGEESVMSTRFALAVKLEAGDDVYKQAHDTLITFNGKIGKASLSRIAEGLGLDAETILSRMDDPEIDRVIQENRDLAGRMQINGTPTFVLGDQMLRGYVPLSALMQIAGEIRDQ